MNISTTSPKIILSIVTWNHERTIKATLDSILQQTYENFEVVVVDNYSTDKTLEIIEPFVNEKIHLVKNMENVGFCGGHNQIIQSYSFDYILLVNPDIVLKNNYLEQTLKAFEKDSRIGAVCGLLVQSFDENPIIDSTGMNLVKSRRFTLINHGLPLSSANVKSGYVSGLDGALPMFKWEAVNSLLIGNTFFNELFFAHKEDWDVSWRLLLYGWKTYFNKDSVAIHPRYFKPNKLKDRLKIDNKIKYDAFKNQFLLLLINEDKRNFFKDSFIIIPRLAATTFFCLIFERKSLNAFKFLLANRKQIMNIRKEVQSSRRISSAEFRSILQ
jgi:GT2 family glycosyltransferase